MKILVPVDFSDQSLLAVKTAKSIAEAEKGEVVLLHMLDIPNFYGTDIIRELNSDESFFMMKGAKQKMEEFLEKVKSDSIEISSDIKLDNTYTGIIEYAEDVAADYILMGSHGASGIKEVFVGSNTEKVVRRSTVPVICVKDYQENLQFKNVVFASNFYKESDTVLPYLKQFVKDFNCNVHLLRVNTEKDFETTWYSRKVMQKFIEEADLGTECTINIYNDDSVENGIMRFANEINADAMLVSTHHRRGLNHWFNGSLGSDLVNHAIHPVVTFRIK
ncbi:MAG: universal stress protein [Crocinitomicaceae bacterium]|nr:universal stress protein [Crocinitomicaceae bacterium]